MCDGSPSVAVASRAASLASTPTGRSTTRPLVILCQPNSSTEVLAEWRERGTGGTCASIRAVVVPCPWILVMFVVFAGCGDRAMVVSAATFELVSGGAQALGDPQT
jgi:hypothetical protein